jgi:hypothetical protein
MFSPTARALAIFLGGCGGLVSVPSVDADPPASEDAGSPVDATVQVGGDTDAQPTHDASSSRDASFDAPSAPTDASHDVTCSPTALQGAACLNLLIYPFYCSTAASTCGCVPSCGEPRTTCAVLGASCGPVPDGFGGVLNCGTCPSSDICVKGHCTNADAGCVPATCAMQGISCGLAEDGCGQIIQCGIGPGCSFWSCVPSDPACPDPSFPTQPYPPAPCPEGLLCPVPRSTCCTTYLKCTGGQWQSVSSGCP